MRIGKYDVSPGAGGFRERGAYEGHAHLTWNEGGATLEKTLYFDKTFRTMDEAMNHALEQVTIRVESGEL